MVGHFLIPARPFVFVVLQADVVGEAQAAAHLRHSNIVHIYEVGEVGGVPFFSMEYGEGGDLDQQLRGGPLPARRAASRHPNPSH